MSGGLSCIRAFALSLAGTRSELDNVTVRIPEIDRVQESVVRYAARVDPFLFTFCKHRVQGVVVDLERDVQIVIVLLFEFEGLAGRFEEGQE